MLSREEVIVKGFHERDLVGDTYEAYAYNKLNSFATGFEDVLSFLCLSRTWEGFELASLE